MSITCILSFIKIIILDDGHLHTVDKVRFVNSLFYSLVLSMRFYPLFLSVKQVFWLISRKTQSLSKKKSGYKQE